MKDPIVLLQEIEEIEKAEGEVSSEPLPNEKGLLEKKRKLHGNLDRIMKYWVSCKSRTFFEKISDQILTSMHSKRKTRKRHTTSNSELAPDNYHSLPW